MQPSQQPSRSLPAAKQPEIIPHHQNRVEPTQPAMDLRERQHMRILDPARTTRLDRQRRCIDSHDRLSTVLQIQATSAGATTDIQHPSAHIFHCCLLMSRPVLEFREIVRRTTRRIKSAIVTLHDFPGGFAVQMVPHDPTIGILLFRQHNARSLRQRRTDINAKNFAEADRPVILKYTCHILIHFGR
jgi:hypothetical protein